MKIRENMLTLKKNHLQSYIHIEPVSIANINPGIILPSSDTVFPDRMKGDLMKTSQIEHTYSGIHKKSNKHFVFRR